MALDVESEEPGGTIPPEVMGDGEVPDDDWVAIVQVR